MNWTILNSKVIIESQKKITFKNQCITSIKKYTRDHDSFLRKRRSCCFV